VIELVQKLSKLSITHTRIARFRSNFVWTLIIIIIIIIIKSFRPICSRAERNMLTIQSYNKKQQTVSINVTECLTIKFRSSVFVVSTKLRCRGRRRMVMSGRRWQACRGYEIIHPYPYPYPQIFRGYPWIYPHPQMPIICRLTYRPMH